MTYRITENNGEKPREMIVVSLNPRDSLTNVLLYDNEMDFSEYTLGHFYRLIL